MNKEGEGEGGEISGSLFLKKAPFFQRSALINIKHCPKFPEYAVFFVEGQKPKLYELLQLCFPKVKFVWYRAIKEEEL